DESSGLAAPVQLGGVQWPYAFASIGDGRIATLATNSKEALIFDLSVPGLPAGDSYVLNEANAGPFVHAFTQPPYYASAEAGASVTFPLLPLSLNSFAATGQTDPASPAIFDSGAVETVWHRVFLEGVIPPRCGVVVWLAASDTASDLTATATRWYPHIAGDADVSGIAPDVLADVPRAVWQSTTPEVAFAPALLDADPIQDRQGLFMVLLQRAGKAVRNLQGRYLGVRVSLNGDRRNTPELAALRAYASRFSYVDHYLPEIYREDKFGAEADHDGASTRRDFFERFVDSFEAQLTRIEDRVAGAYLLTRPESTPDDSLDWLGAWVGIEPSGYPPARRRARLAATPDLYRKRGTAKGLTLALDVATDGMCTRGAIVVIEDFRLRHIFATIVGSDLSIKDDPLLPGYSPSSNSIVGDTLFLGDPRMQAELQVLYETNLNLASGTQSAATFYDEFANRVTVFIHDQVETVDALLVARLVEREKPAHVAASIQRASQSFMIGLASLLGVNTYLASQPPRATATLDVSQIGRYDVITTLPTLDPRLENGGAFAETTPVARLSGPRYVLQGDTIALDGSGSGPAPGHRIVSYQWALRPLP
ncbi:MAG: phage tail protein, partial [Candidatus Tumulicola sp.]